MSVKMLRFVKYVTLGSAPAITFGLTRAEASELAPNKRLVKPKDLPLYEEEKQEWEFQTEEREPNALEGSVTVVRQQVWKMTDACQGAIDTTRKVYQTVEKTSKDVITYIKTEEGFYPRAGVIGIAGLTGIVLARKGGLLRKMIYSGGLMAGAASLCYPYKAVQLTQAEYGWVKDRMTELYSSQSSEKKESTAEDKSDAKVEPKQEKEIERTAKSDTPTSSQERDAQIEPGKDFGQSNPADKDMYTTRS